ncbi:MAG: hypothetical protein ACP5MD_12530 [Verrucomicrobiia bacterium]
MSVVRSVLYIERSQTDDRTDQPLKTFNVQSSTYSVQLTTFNRVAGWPTECLYSPAALTLVQVAPGCGICELD